jgi:hypothetical protein
MNAEFRPSSACCNFAMALKIGVRKIFSLLMMYLAESGVCVPNNSCAAVSAIFPTDFHLLGIPDDRDR